MTRPGQRRDVTGQNEGGGGYTKRRDSCVGPLHSGSPRLTPIPQPNATVKDVVSTFVGCGEVSIKIGTLPLNELRHGKIEENSSNRA